ncbi:MAG: serine/threonine-protein kinase [Planctomycetota bacterium]
MPRSPRAFAAAEAPESSDPELAGIGPYRVLAKLGEGGMGVVYLAEQQRPKRRVAVKVLRAELMSVEVRRRFAHEAELLGRLQHPGIARVYEAGTSDTEQGPQAYIVMEYIDGKTLASCQRGNGVARAALTTIAKICDAVQHAHDHGVIHRDLKPSNILIDRHGEPRIFDFGIARAIDRDGDPRTLQTIAGQVLGTVDYMSPEQAAGDLQRVGVRSDVYSIAVLGYELLAGELPYAVRDQPLSRALRVVHEADAIPLATRDPRLRGDLDTIFRKALEKDPERRYVSAAEVARDLRNHLSDRPIRARPPTAAYYFGRWARRHRGLAAGVLIAALASTAGSVLAVWWAIEAGHQAQAAKIESRVAREEARVANHALAFVERLFSGAAPQVAAGETLTAADLVERGRRELASGWADVPRVRSRLRSFLGGVLQDLGRMDEAEPMILAALREARESGATGDDLAAFVLQAGRLHLGQGAFEEARRCFDEVLAILDLESTPDPGTAIDAACGLAGVAMALEQTDAARAWVVRATTQAAGLDDQYSRLNALLFAARFYASVGDDERAEALWQRVMHVVPVHADTERAGFVAASLGMFRLRQGRTDEALRLAERALEIGEHIYAANHPRLIPRLVNLAGLHGMARRVDLAEELLERALDIHRTSGRPPSLHVSKAMQSLGNVRMRQGRADAACELFAQATQTQERLVGPSSSLAASLRSLGLAQAATGAAAAAIASLERSLAIGAALSAGGAAAPGADKQRWVYQALADSYEAVGRTADAAAARRRAADLGER